jgi:hypothetical protein
MKSGLWQSALLPFYLLNKLLCIDRVEKLKHPAPMRMQILRGLDVTPIVN